jgi:DNA-binding response OmpR family regulator
VYIDLTKREFALLEYLLHNPRRVVTRAQILEHVWDDTFAPVANAVDVLVARLRGKIDRSPSAPLLHTVRGSGYMLTDELSHADGDGA